MDEGWRQGTSQAWRTVFCAKGTTVAGNHLSGIQDDGHQGDMCSWEKLSWSKPGWLQSAKGCEHGM